MAAVCLMIFIAKYREPWPVRPESRAGVNGVSCCLTKWRRMTLGRFASSKWQGRLATDSSSSSAESAS